MAVIDSGTKSTTGSGTEDTLNSSGTSTAGTYMLNLDLNDLVAGDILHVYCKSKTLTGGTARLGPVDVWISGDDVVNGTQKVFDFDPFYFPYGVTFYLAQTVGTASIPWSVNSP